MTIVQPNDFRDDKIRHWDLTREELLQKFRELSSTIEYNAFHQTEYFPGSHCRLCDCIIICPILQLEIKTIDHKKEIANLSIKEKARLLEMQNRIESFFKKLYTSVIADVNNGVIKPNEIGLKWIKGNNQRRIVNEKELINHLLKKGFKEELLKIPTLKWLEENIEDIDDWLEKTERPPRLVTIDTKGKEIEPTKELVEKFKKG